MDKKTVLTHLTVLLIGIAIGYAVTKYWVVSPKAVTIAVVNCLRDFGISETNAPTEQIISLVWQAVENPRRHSWTVSTQSWNEPVGPQFHFDNTVKTNSYGIIGASDYNIPESSQLPDPTNGAINNIP